MENVNIRALASIGSEQQVLRRMDQCGHAAAFVFGAFKGLFEGFKDMNLKEQDGRTPKM